VAAKIVIIFGFAITFGFICCCKVIGAHQLPMTDAATPRIAHKTLRRGTNGSILNCAPKVGHNVKSYGER
jgi:hypothetical protein